jgi:hypothetical protein
LSDMLLYSLDRADRPEQAVSTSPAPVGRVEPFGFEPARLPDVGILAFTPRRAVGGISLDAARRGQVKFDALFDCCRRRSPRNPASEGPYLFAAAIIARMPARIGSGRSGHAATIAARSAEIPPSGLSWVRPAVQHSPCGGAMSIFSLVLGGRVGGLSIRWLRVRVPSSSLT